MKKSLLQFIIIIPLALLLCFTFSCQQQVEEGITEEAKPTVDIEADVEAIKSLQEFAFLGSNNSLNFCSDFAY